LLNSKVAAAAAVAAFAAVVAAGWWIVSPGEAEFGETPGAAAVRPGVEPVAAVAAKQPVAPSGGVVKENESLAELKASVQRLKDAGNWNVFVLHASKWTREEPGNATAWNELSAGYVRLHQLDDALSAATKAAELSPEDVALWRNVGHLNLTLERLPEAGAAFARVLAANSEDTDALCGSALAAHGSGRVKDAFAFAGRVKAAGGSCQGLSDGESVAVVVKAPGSSKPASPVRRQP
jgi:tetratricopeptide (TPR) repeat protein